MKYPVITEQELKSFLSEEEDAIDSDTPFSTLAGRTIYCVFANVAEDVIYFDCGSDGFWGYRAEGDCCSETWIADIFHFSNLFSKVLVIEEILLDNYNTEDNRCRQESDEVYGYRFKTEKGTAVMSFRNSSNGYYGGWVEFIGTEMSLPSGFKKIQPDENDIWQSSD